MKKFKFAKHVSFILTAAAVWFAMSAFGVYNSSAAEISGRKISVAGIDAPAERRAMFEEEMPENRDISLIPKRPAPRMTGESDDDGYVKHDFIVPVTHKTAAPDGYSEIRTQNDLDGMRYNLSGKFILMNDITMDGTWVPVGDSFGAFSGILDGNGYAIKNMKIEISDSVAGLFGKTSGAEIMNLGMESSGIEYGVSEINSYGGIVAEMRNSVIDNCYNKGNIEGHYYYYSETGTVSDYVTDAGGIAASVTGSTVKNCYNSGYIINSVWAGGVVGYMYSGAVENCYNEGFIGAGGYAGGITAKLTGDIKKCYNSGEIYCTSEVAGGIAGYNTFAGDVIENCYNSGSVSVAYIEYTGCGGIIGALSAGSVLNSYNSNGNTGSGIFGSASYYSDGENGYYSDIYLSNCYYPESLYIDIDNIDFFQYLNVENFRALSEYEMKRKESFEGFNFEDVWDIKDIAETPVLRSISTKYIYLTGAVTDYLTGDLITDADIIFRIWGENSDKPVEFRTLSRENGEYSVWILPGVINIRVNKSGYISFSNGNGEEFTEDNNYDIALKREQDEGPLPLSVLTGNTILEEATEGSETKKRSVGGVTIEVESYDKSGNAYIYTTLSTTPADVNKISKFQAFFYPGRVRITAYKKGYGNVYIQTRLDEAQADYEIAMTALIEQVYIEMDIKSIEPHYESSEWEKPVETNVSNFGALEFKLIDKSRNNVELLPDKDFTISGNHLVITHSSAAADAGKDDNSSDGEAVIEGHILEIIVNDISGRMGTASASFTFTGDKENSVPPLLLTFTEQGRWETSGNTDESFDTAMALLFGEDGGLRDRFMPVDRHFTGKQLPDGEYTLVFTENYPGLQYVPDLSYFRDNGFVEGTDYISISLEIKRGIISVADMTGKSVPGFDPLKEYLNLDGTSLTLSRYQTPKQYSVGAYVHFSIDKKHIYPDTDAEISVTLTKNCAVYRNKIWLDDEECVYSEAGGRISIIVPSEIYQETIRGLIYFPVIANDYGENTVNAELSFTNRRGEKITCPIGTVNLLSYEVEITNLPARSTGNQYTVTGNAASGTWVSVYVDGVEMMPAVKANSVGSWKKNLVLYGEESGETVFNIKAANSSGISTKEFELICDISAPSVSAIKLGTRNYNNDFYGGISVVYDGGEWVSTEYSDKRVTQPFSYIRYVEPWFYGDMREKISFEVSFDELPANSQVRIAAYDGSGKIIAYVLMNYDSGKRVWEGSRDFSDNQLPQIMSVLYTARNTAGESAVIESEKIMLLPLLDPSGFVYEAVESNKTEDAEIILIEKTDYGTEEEWNAEDYDQLNPLYTAADGNYMWDIPEGEYQVRVLKEGYQPAESEWVTVPTPLTNVNIGLISYKAPEILSSKAFPDYVEIEFSKYMDMSTLNKNSIILRGDSEEYDIHILGINAEENPADNSVMYASIIGLYPKNGGKFKIGGSLEIRMGGEIKSYAGVSMGRSYLHNLEVEIKDEVIEVPEGVGEKEEVTEDGVKYNYISGIDAGSEGITAADFTEKLTVKDGYSVEVIGKDGKKITDELIGTGMILQVAYENGMITEEYTLVVKYDVTGAGKSGLSDMFLVLDYSLDNITFDSAQKLAIRGDKKGLSLIFHMIDYAVGNQ